MEYQIAMFSYDIERLTAQIHKVVKLLRRFISAVDHIRHIRRQYERRAVPANMKSTMRIELTKTKYKAIKPFEIAKHLSVAEKFAKVNVEQVSGGFEHNIVVVSVANAKNVSGDAVAGTGGGKVFDRSLVFQFRRVVFCQPLGDRSVFERSS